MPQTSMHTSFMDNLGACILNNHTYFFRQNRTRPIAMDTLMLHVVNSQFGFAGTHTIEKVEPDRNFLCTVIVFQDERWIGLHRQLLDSAVVKRATRPKFPTRAHDPPTRAKLGHMNEESSQHWEREVGCVQEVDAFKIQGRDNKHKTCLFARTTTRVAASAIGVQTPLSESKTLEGQYCPGGNGLHLPTEWVCRNCSLLVFFFLPSAFPFCRP